MRVENWNPFVFDDKIRKAAIDRLEAVANEIADDARRRCPVGKAVKAGEKAAWWEGRKPGALRDTIRVVRLYGDKNNDVRVYAGNRKGGVFYAHFVEHGTIKMAAKPFLRPALMAVKGKVQAIIDSVSKPVEL
jgi:HK97 gp10 family phage protein